MLPAIEKTKYPSFLSANFFVYDGWLYLRHNAKEIDDERVGTLDTLYLHYANDGRYYADVLDFADRILNNKIEVYPKYPQPQGVSVATKIHLEE